MLFIIANPEKILLRTEVKLLQLPGLDGSFEIMENHAPLISVLKSGKVRYIDKDDKENFFPIEGGLFGISANEARLILV